MLVNVADGKTIKNIEVKFHKVPRVLTKTRFKGRKVIDTACVVSERVGAAAGKVAKNEIVKAVAIHCAKDRYNTYRGKQVALDRALSMTDELSPLEKKQIVEKFEVEFYDSKKKAGLVTV